MAEADSLVEGILQRTRALVTNLKCTLESPGECSQSTENRTSGGPGCW